MADVCLLSFDAPTAVAGWSAIDDAVMGGCSRSQLRHEGAGDAEDGAAGFAVFEGVVSLAQNGGFASVRSPARDFGVPGAFGVTGYALQVCGDGARYTLALRGDDRFDGISHQAGFAPPAGEWVTVQLPLTAFSARFRGRAVPEAPPLAPAQVRQIGLLVADRQAGPFRLALRAIWAVGAVGATGA
jgi:NADH dehydrogenase [ubiquinone] 1 alpha subcomplex assembly factor 1